MGRKCSVPGCRSGYYKESFSSSSSPPPRISKAKQPKMIKVKDEIDSEKSCHSPSLSRSPSSCSNSSSASSPTQSRTSGDPLKIQKAKIVMFSFPSKDPKLLKQWIDAIPFTTPFTPTKNSAVCSRHFAEDDLTGESFDSNRSRKNKPPLPNRRQIKRFPDAIPSLFPDTPGYKPPYVERPPRIKVVPLKAKTPIEETEIVPPKLSLAENIILGLDSIRNGQDKISHLPEGVSIVDRKDHMLFIRFTGRPPWRVAYYLQINENLTFSAVVRNIKLKPEKYRHLAGQTIPLLTIISEMLVLLNHEYKGLPVPKEVKKEAVPIWTGETEEDEKGDENKDGGLSWNIDI